MVATSGLTQQQITELLCEGKAAGSLCSAIHNEVRSLCFFHKRTATAISRLPHELPDARLPMAVGCN